MSAERDGAVGRSVADRPPVSGAVLAGGRSRRLGRDKRFVTVGGEPLLTRTVGLLAAVAD
ncbi:MAG: NTP transferase domain-containing protein, partial [Nitriliruptoraceae bacterium]